jgi:hypothetical protein
MSLLALLLAMSPLSLAVPFAPSSSSIPLGRNFTVNLLTQVQDMSVQSDPTGQSPPISYHNATIQRLYDNVTYSVVGSLLFESIGVPQTYQIETSLWGKAVR